MKIRSKMTVVPIIALLIPLIVSIFYIRSFGRFYYEKQKGILYLTIAEELVIGLKQGVLSQADHLSYWIEHSGIRKQLENLPDHPPDSETIQHIEQQWPSLQPTDPLLQSILRNPCSEQLILFLRTHPMFAEILLTDRHGQLVAATNPTSDYWQADEEWWKAAIHTRMMPAGWTRGIIYDESAGVQAMDISLPIRNHEGQLIGVVKGSLKANEVLRILAPNSWNEQITRDVFLHDGTLVIRLNPPDGSPIPYRASPEGLEVLQANPETWQTVELYPGTVSLAACVPVSPYGPTEAQTAEDQRIYVVVHRDQKNAMAPVAKIIHDLTVRGSLLLVLIAVLSYLGATFWFAGPLKVLHGAAQSMAAHVRIQEEGRIGDARESLREVGQSLRKLDSIRTHDEMQELAGVFAHMGGRMLNFHRHLERELTRKTEEVHEDLIMAREFQEALLPSGDSKTDYPVEGGVYNLRFNHIYRPAQSVSGDFFDIAEIPNGCIRVFVADVIGHGARSALMTAILHALIHSEANGDDDPSRLLGRMNEEFYAIGQRTGEMVFVTAIHLLIDLHRRLIRYAAAGHPSPLIIDNETGGVDLLIPDARKTPAAGLFSDSVYEEAQLPIDREQTILLYTDGVTEAQNPRREEFGRPRLIHTVRESCSSEKTCALPEYLIETLDAFMDTAPTLDDICLVSIDITKIPKR